MSSKPSIARRIEIETDPFIFQKPSDEKEQSQDQIMSEMIYNMKGVMTKFVTQNFFPHDQGPTAFLAYIIQMFNHFISEYIIEYNNKHKTPIEKDEIIFMYKGGNVVRMILLQYLKHLPSKIARNIDLDYGRYMSRSDADFQIMINPNHPDYENIYVDMGYLSYNVLELIKQEFEQQLYTGTYFTYPKLSPNVKEQILGRYFGDLEAVIAASNRKGGPLYAIDYLICGDTVAKSPMPRISLKEFPMGHQATESEWTAVSNPRFHSFVFKFNPKKPTSQRRNLFITPGSNTSTKVYVIGQQNKSIFYNSLNTAIMYASELHPELVTQFTLARMKISVMTIFTSSTAAKECGYISVPGELIDVAIPHRKSYELHHLMGHSRENKIPSHITPYVFQDANYSFNFNTYTTQALLENFEKMLFVEHATPWSEKKYEKHLVRYMMLTFFESLSSTKLVDLSMYLNNFMRKILMHREIEIEHQIPEYGSFWTFHNKIVAYVDHQGTKDDYLGYSEYLTILSRLISLFIDICASIQPSLLINGIVYIDTRQLAQMGGKKLLNRKKLSNRKR
jgi:hypothetical protein